MSGVETANRFAPLDGIERTQGRDEMNLAEFPLAAITHRISPRQKTLVFEDDIFDEGTRQRVHRKLVISASEHSGLPTALDSDVLLVLVHLTNVRNGFNERTVPFSRYELVKFMGWDDGGKSYRRLDEALTRWASVTLYYNRAWWDKSGRKWRSRTFHVLESLDLRGREGKTSGGDPLSSFTWNQVLFDSFRANNIKRLNLDVYFRLERPAARQAYRFLDKRFYRASRLEFDLRTFACEHVGLSRSYDSAQLKRRLQPSLEELEMIGFLRPATPKERYASRTRGDWRIILERAGSRCEKHQSAGNSGSSVVQRLIDRGIQQQVASDLARQFSARHIDEQINQFDKRLADCRGPALRNPPGLLVEGIRGFGRPTTRYRSQPSSNGVSSSPVTPSSRGVSAKTAPPQEQDELAAFREEWDALPPDRRKGVLDAAIRSANPFQADTLARLEATNHPLVEEVRLSLAHAYLRGTKN